MIKLFYGEHRSRELAERRARELQRENPTAKVEIVARRRADGRFSKHGTQWTFRATREEVKKEVDTLEEFLNELAISDEFEPEEDYETAPDYEG